jgi:hypothetical protein
MKQLQGSLMVKTIPLVEPPYCDKLICELDKFTEEDLQGALLVLMRQDSEAVGRVHKNIAQGKIARPTLKGYIRFFKRLGLVERKGKFLVRTDLGDKVAQTDGLRERKELWYEIVRKDPHLVFERYFEFMNTPRTFEEIKQVWNPATGKYLHRWAQWLGIQVYDPTGERYLVIISDAKPTKELFFEALSDVYFALRRSEFAGVPRYDVTIPEVRFKLCQELGIRPIVFEALLTQILEDKYYGRLVRVFGEAYQVYERYKGPQPFRYRGRYHFISVYLPKEE